MPRPKTGNLQRGWKKPELTLKQRRDIFFTCINVELRGGFKRGFFKTLSSNLPVGLRTVSATWYELRQKYEENVRPIAATNIDNVINDLPDEFFATKKKLTGQNSRRYHPEVVAAALTLVPFRERQAVASSARAIGMATSTFHRIFKEEEACIRHSNALKTVLTDENKVS
jgi:hypothetical protein